MDFLFLGGHTAVDFLNTHMSPRGTPIETLPDGEAFVAWLVAAGLVDEAGAAALRRRYGGKALDAAAGEARGMREWARPWLQRWRTTGKQSPRDIAELNRLLRRVPLDREIVATPAGPRLVERPRIADPGALVGLIAQQLATLITLEDPALLKACAGPECTLWFVDRTKSHRRRFCSAGACGNRAKVSAFRERQRSG